VSRVRSHSGKLAWQRYWRLRRRVDAAERIEEELTDAGRCRRCGRALTDPKSVADSIGPACKRKVARRVSFRRSPTGQPEIGCACWSALSAPTPTISANSSRNE
jgi:hypothetical protein